jgi:hypothetical protein
MGHERAVTASLEHLRAAGAVPDWATDAFVRRVLDVMEATRRCSRRPTPPSWAVG